MGKLLEGSGPARLWVACLKSPHSEEGGGRVKSSRSSLVRTTYEISLGSGDPILIKKGVGPEVPVRKRKPFRAGSGPGMLKFPSSSKTLAFILRLLCPLNS